MATILVIDDQEPIRALLRLALEGAGHDVLEASNGRLGLALYRASEADLIITDIVMPEMDGLELMLELTSTFHKPFEMDKLHSAVRDALAAHSAQS